jgi:hypothetical protein
MNTTSHLFHFHVLIWQPSVVIESAFGFERDVRIAL